MVVFWGSSFGVNGAQPLGSHLKRLNSHLLGEQDGLSTYDSFQSPYGWQWHVIQFLGEYCLWCCCPLALNIAQDVAMLPPLSWLVHSVQQAIQLTIMESHQWNAGSEQVQQLWNNTVRLIAAYPCHKTVQAATIFLYRMP